MEARVQIISREIIKPSSKTFHHLKKLKFSYLDQLAMSQYVPMIFFYQADESRGLTNSNHTQRSKQLKQSLSKTLTTFYPFSGRIEDSFVIDCSDAGVEFVEARVRAHLIDAIQEPDAEELKAYVPVLDPATCGHAELGALVLVQVTFFDCGGIAVGICISHRIADCASIMAFVNTWAAICRGEAEFCQFHFDMANYFPPRDFPGNEFLEPSMSNEKLVTKRFVFDKEKLAALKKAATSSYASTVKDPTRVEVISAFIWKHFMEMVKSTNLDTNKTFAASHVVSLRTRTSPPQILENVLGNCSMCAFAFSDNSSDQYEGVQEFHDLVNKLRSAIKAINNEYITKARNGDDYLNDLYKMSSRLATGEVEFCCFTSWCRFPMYEVDYGWGKPIWFGTTVLPLKNAIVLVSTRCGQGIEAWINMEQNYLEKLETQIKLIPTDVKDMIAA